MGGKWKTSPRPTGRRLHLVSRPRSKQDISWTKYQRVFKYIQRRLPAHAKKTCNKIFWKIYFKNVHIYFLEKQPRVGSAAFWDHSSLTIHLLIAHEKISQDASCAFSLLITVDMSLYFFLHLLFFFGWKWFVHLQTSSVCAVLQWFFPVPQILFTGAHRNREGRKRLCTGQVPIAVCSCLVPAKVPVLSFTVFITPLSGL